MVIFHSYVKLPEGTSVSDQVTELKMPPGDYSSPPIDQQLLHKIWRIRLEQNLFGWAKWGVVQEDTTDFISQV